MHTSALFYFYFLKCAQIKFHMYCTIFNLEHIALIHLRVLPGSCASCYITEACFMVLSSKGLQKCNEVLQLGQMKNPYHNKQTNKQKDIRQFEVK